MKFKKSFKVLVLLMLSVFILTPDTVSYAADKNNSIVSTDHQKYSYDEMTEDLKLLKDAYPDLIHVISIGTTVHKKDIPLVTLGNPNAKTNIMITASIHAREYMTTLFVMKEIEYLSSCNDDIFSDVCFHIVPMVNPDGVEISQNGIDPAKSDMLWLNTQKSIEQIKSNANGVDLNRNWPAGFGLDAKKASGPSLDHFPGYEALSEPEVKALKSYIDTHDIDAYLNYHTQGGVIYYDSPKSKKEVSERSCLLAKTIGKTTKYQLISENTKDCVAYGSFSDYVQLVLERPSVTIEIGHANPVPVSEFDTIFALNKDSWINVANSITW